MLLLDGKLVAESIKNDIRSRIALARPKLSVILVGDNPSSKLYIERKQKECKEIGITSELYTFPQNTTTRSVIDCVKNLKSSHGILVQLPLPDHLDRNAILSAVNPLKDIDCFHPENIGLLCQGKPRFFPCTPHGIVEIFKFYNISTRGSSVAIVNRSIVVGQPLFTMLSQDYEFGNATVTICHEHTKNLEEITKRADIIITAVGKRPKYSLTVDMVKEGQVVIDVGVNRINGKIVGDADEGVYEKVKAITPAVGGVGPCTIACLLRNTLLASERLRMN